MVATRIAAEEIVKEEEVIPSETAVAKDAATPPWRIQSNIEEDREYAAEQAAIRLQSKKEDFDEPDVIHNGEAPQWNADHEDARSCIMDTGASTSLIGIKYMCSRCNSIRQFDTKESL